MEAGVTPLGDAYLAPPIWDRVLGPPVISNIMPIKVFISQCNGNIFMKVTHMVYKICKRSNNTVLKATDSSARNTHSGTLRPCWPGLAYPRRGHTSITTFAHTEVHVPPPPPPPPPPLDKMAAISQTTVSNAFSWMKSFCISIRIPRSLFPRAQLTISQHRFR